MNPKEVEKVVIHPETGGNAQERLTLAGAGEAGHSEQGRLLVLIAFPSRRSWFSADPKTLHVFTLGKLPSHPYSAPDQPISLLGVASLLHVLNKPKCL